MSALDPPVVQFTAIARRNNSLPMKDSVQNVLDTREFVVCLVDETLVEKVNATATEFPRDVSEFDVVGLSRETSLAVRPPRVGESLAAIECRLLDTKKINDDVVVFGEVVCIAVDEAVLHDGYPEPLRVNPVARLGRGRYSTLGSIVAWRVPPYGPRERRG